MTDTQAQSPVPMSQGEVENIRTVTIIIYGLYLAALINGLTAIVGVILAYVKRDDARGTVYESHFSNAIELFWATLVIGIVGIATAWFGIGVLILLGLFVWYLYRSVKGIVRAIDAKPYY